MIEDLHWADAALLDFVEDLLDWAAPVPLLVVGTARPELYESRPDWGGGRRNSTTVGLSPLTDEETGRLIAALLERSVLPAETQAALLERAGGNPLYTEQFVRMLAERGGEDFPVPETVQALISARLDTLSPQLKSLVQDASVVGKVFWTGALAAMGDRERGDVLEGVRELLRREFVRPARVASMRDEEEFSFWHVLVRDVAYQQIPRGQRAEKHVRAAEWVEQAAQERVSDHAEILVYHYDQAIELRKAAGESRPGDDLEQRLAGFLVLAGDRAMQLDIDAAETAYRRALELSEGPARAAALVKIADALQEQGRLVEAEQAYEEALPALDERAAAVAKLGLSRALWRHGDTSRAHATTLEAIPVLERDPGLDLVLAYGRAAGADAMGGRSREAIAWAEKGLALAEALGVENVVRQLQMRGLARIELGDLSGLDDLREALDLALELGLGIEAATSYGNLGEVVSVFDGVAAGLALVEEGHEFARRRGLTHHEMWSRTSRLSFLYDLGHWDELLREAEDVVRWDREQGGTQIEVMALMFSTPVHAQRGNLDEAARQASIFLPRAREIADPQILEPALVQAAFVFALGGELDEAASLVAEYERERPGRLDSLPIAVLVSVAAGRADLAESLVEGAAEAVPLPASRHALTSAKAIVAESRGRKDEAASLYAEAAAGWQEWGSVVGRGYALLGLGRCGDEDALREGDEIFERLGAVPFTAIAA